MRQQTSQFSDKAANYFKQDYNCAQSVLLTMQEYYGIRRNRLIPKIAIASDLLREIIDEAYCISSARADAVLNQFTYSGMMKIFN